jgi:hypothetical protein
MTSKLISRRLLETVGLFLIGDGLMGILRPRRHSLLWHFGPELGRAVTEELVEHPKMARSVYLAEVALGIVLSCAQTDDHDLS